ncbi:MAG: hypothetical protein GY851_03275 [bacterium]|nr:hypothetical protein [bacterium]
MKNRDLLDAAWWAFAVVAFAVGVNLMSKLVTAIQSIAESLDVIAKTFG